MTGLRRVLGAALIVLAGAARAEAGAPDAASAAAEFRATHNYAHSRGLAIVPGVSELVELLNSGGVRPVHRRLMQDGFGLNLDGGQPVGLFVLHDHDMKVGAFGCVACHSGRAAGRLVIGLGNKGIDVATIGRSIGKFEKPFKWLGRSHTPAQQAIIDRAFAFARNLADPAIANATKGMVSMNHVNRWFFEAGGQRMPASLPRAGTKVPHLWGIEPKAAREGLFWDGLGKAGSIGWLALPELTAGQTADNIRADWSRIERLWQLIGRFEPPAYPFALDRDAAARGQAVFERTCTSCHGAYERDAGGSPVYQAPRFVKIEAVRTDASRLDAAGEALRAAIARSPLRDLVEAGDRPRGYFAPRLEGLWARYPYLHNGAVPTLADLLEPSALRPVAWSLDRPGDEDRFDRDRVGYTIPARGTLARDKVETLGRHGARDVYFTGREGHSNQGHEFGTDLSGADKLALIEYLKSL